MITTEYTESELQDKVGKFVCREVIQCVSNLIYTLGKTEGLHLYDAFPHLYKGAPTYGVSSCNSCGNSWESEPLGGLTPCPECNKRDCDFEPTEYADICEHFIVSNWLADKLADKEEAIEKDFYGLNIWGRSCSGQAIRVDDVIRDIWKELQEVKP